MTTLTGRVWRFGNDINTDFIVPGRYLKLTAAEAAPHVLESIAPGFAQKIQAGDIIVAGRNFGCGSSRESAPAALKIAGIAAIVAETFARIFFRNAISLGLPVIELADTSPISEGTTLELTLEKGGIKDLGTGATYTGLALPPHLLEMLQAGGLVPYLEKRMQSLAQDTPSQDKGQTLATT